MRKQGSVTVTFSLVFVLLFGFILSFFEMASHTARAAYHASAGKLAVENFFAGYNVPLFEEYHLFGREVSDEDKKAYTKNEIAKDIAYMTEKREGERSLLLRGGAAFDVDSVRVLTDDGLEGFYSQAITAMKYRGVTEIVDTLKKFGDVSNQANAQLEVATAKTETDMAYGKVDERILQLITLIDGVDIVQYEKFLGGEGVLFQKEAYVKYFCVSPETAAAYFDRTEVYRAFLDNYENPKVVLDDLYEAVRTLATEVRERELQSASCDARLTELQGLIEEVTAKIEESEALEEESEKQEAESSEATETESTDEQLQQYYKELEQYENEKESLERLKEALDKKKEEQIELASLLRLRELVFVKKSESIRDICEEAYFYVGELKTELAYAKQVRKGCESLITTLQPVIGADTAKEYREELQEYTFYEDMEGYDFDRMKQTLLDNKSRLLTVKSYITEFNADALDAAAEGLRYEAEIVGKYSFEGLKLDYGEMVLQQTLYEGVEDTIAGEVAEGYLAFLTEKKISSKEIDTSVLPSGFREEADGDGIFSMLGGDMDEIFQELQGLLPEDTETAFEGISDAVLFHAYLMTHFSNYLEGNPDGALSYEQEYLIAGKKTDEQNLASVAMRICAIRTVLHFVSLYTDNARKAPVELAALALCGGIGLPALKNIVVFGLLFAWALEEAMVDTAALMLGKKVSLYPGKDDGSISFSETVLFSKSFVRKKAEQKKDVKGLGFGYKEFLHLFVFLTSRDNKKYRAADLIQENLRTTYNKEFRLKHCVWEMRYRIDGKRYTYCYE